MTSDPIYDFLYFGAQFFIAFSILGVASMVLESQDDDDDDPRGGTMIPCYQQAS
jgi:hypothetical protein